MYEDEELKEQQVEHPDTGTPQGEDTPEFGLDKDGNLNWNTNEYSQYDDEDSQ